MAAPVLYRGPYRRHNPGGSATAPGPAGSHHDHQETGTAATGGPDRAQTGQDAPEHRGTAAIPARRADTGGPPPAGTGPGGPARPLARRGYPPTSTTV